MTVDTLQRGHISLLTPGSSGLLSAGDYRICSYLLVVAAPAASAYWLLVGVATGCLLAVYWLLMLLLRLCLRLCGYGERAGCQSCALGLLRHVTQRRKHECNQVGLVRRCAVRASLRAAIRRHSQSAVLLKCCWAPHVPHAAMQGYGYGQYWNPAPYRTVPYRTVPYRTAPYRTVPCCTRTSFTAMRHALRQQALHARVRAPHFLTVSVLQSLGAASVSVAVVAVVMPACSSSSV